MTGFSVDFFKMMDDNRIIIATNGFMKKTKKTPRREIDIAKKRRKIYFDRKGEMTGGMKDERSSAIDG